MRRDADDVTGRAWNTTLEPPPAVICNLPSQFKPKLNLALTELRTAVELSHNSPLMVSALAHANAISGNRAEANMLLAQLMTQSRKEYVSPTTSPSSTWG